ncbi:MAG: ribonuclease HII [Gammaproteobacteria bacterium]|jgi:ribonuclease HII
MNTIFQDELPVVDGLLAGVDEAGRGPLVGNVVAAAVILDNNKPIDGLADSKKLSAKRREQLAEQIRDYAIAWRVISIDAAMIDRINILQATLLAMKQAVEQLNITPDHVFIDGNRCPRIDVPATAIVKGDQRVAEISAASILAKVERDAQMQVLHEAYPQYGFDKHKGYPTKAHVEALAQHGPCPQHRISFRPVRECRATSNRRYQVPETSS